MHDGYLSATSLLRISAVQEKISGKQYIAHVPSPVPISRMFCQAVRIWAVPSEAGFVPEGYHQQVNGKADSVDCCLR